MITIYEHPTTLQVIWRREDLKNFTYNAPSVVLCSDEVVDQIRAHDAHGLVMFGPLGKESLRAVAWMERELVRRGFELKRDRYKRQGSIVVGRFFDRIAFNRDLEGVEGAVIGR
jgi:hypothetical protein